MAANAYLGAWGIVEALNTGADVVVCPRVTDASLVVGPAAWHFGWGKADWDRLASAVVAGHILECGAQATGGNYSFFQEVPGLEHPGFPIAEMHEDGSFVVTKHEGTGGLVSVGTVTAQLLYEIGSERYLNPDVVARFDTIRLEQEGPDRVLVSGVRGEPAPDTTKVCINYLGGFRNTMTFVLTGLDIEAKAKLAEDTLFAALGGKESFDEVSVKLTRSDQEDPASNEEASAFLRVTVKDKDARKVGRAFSSAVVEMALASYPGFTMTSGPQRRSFVRRLLAGARPRGCDRAGGRGARRLARRGPARVGEGQRGDSARDSAGCAGAGRANADACRWARSSARAPATRAATPTSACGPAATADTPGWRTISPSSDSRNS